MGDISLTVDGKQVSVPDGSTILHAARAAGAEVPTLCHRDGLEPWTSCFVCVVEVEGRADLAPACTAPALEGMEVRTDSPAVREARKAALELLLSDHRGDCVAPCSRACPAGLDIPGFIDELRRGDDRAAVAVVKQRIPLPGVLGRVCARYCERVCRRSESEDPIAICALKRAAADLDAAAGEPYVPERASATRKKVAVVGGGPAGLSAAYYLAELGHEITIFDARPEPGGMLRYGIPAFRMPREALDAEVDVIRGLGVAFRQECPVDSAAVFEKLRQGHDALLLAMGASIWDAGELPGAETCLSAGKLLADAGAGERPGLPENVAVLGSGDEAVDAARTALRLGAATVSVIFPEAADSMPARDEYVKAAGEEGVQFVADTRPVQVRQTGPDAFEVVCGSEGAQSLLGASCVVLADGRAVDTDLLAAMGFDTGENGIATDRTTYQTSVPGVFAAGDVVSGPRTVVHAVAAGRSAALCIDQYLRGEQIALEPRGLNVPLGDLSDADREELLQGIAKAPRTLQEAAATGERISGFGEVVAGLSEADVRREARRCLRCDCGARDDCRLRLYAEQYGAQPRRYRGELRPLVRDASSGMIVFEAAKCILCGLCVRIAAQHGEELGVGFSRRGFGTRVAVPFGGSIGDGLRRSAEACAEACPTGALHIRADLEQDG